MGDDGSNCKSTPTGDSASNQNQEMHCLLGIEQEGNVSTDNRIISTENRAQPWPKGYEPSDSFFVVVYLVESATT